MAGRCVNNSKTQHNVGNIVDVNASTTAQHNTMSEHCRRKCVKGNTADVHASTTHNTAGVCVAGVKQIQFVWQEWKLGRVP